MSNRAKLILLIILSLILVLLLGLCAYLENRPYPSEPRETEAAEVTEMPTETTLPTEEPEPSEPAQTQEEETEPTETEPEVTEPTEPTETDPVETEPEETEALLDIDGWYYSAEDVALYLVTYGELPSNFITKKEAQNLGWDSSYNYVGDVAPGKSIGGDRFGNYEGLLPSKKGRTWYEADCYYTKGKRNAHRILYSSDGLVYYTDDHYESFTQMHPSK